jgi:hypothetical protein
MRTAPVRQRPVVGASDPMPGLRHGPHRASGSWGSASRCARSQVARAATSSAPRRQACRRGDPGRAFDCGGTGPTPTTAGAPAQKQQPAAEVCGLCRRLRRARLGRFCLRARLGDQNAGQREYQTHPNRFRRQWRWERPSGRGERCDGRVGRPGRRLFAGPATCQGPAACYRPNTSGPRRAPRGQIHEQHRPGEVQAARASRAPIKHRLALARDALLCCLWYLLFLPQPFACSNARLVLNEGTLKVPRRSNKLAPASCACACTGKDRLCLPRSLRAVNPLNP